MEQSRILFVAPNFTRYQQQSVGFKNIPFELWKITKFGSDIFQLEKFETQILDEELPGIEGYIEPKIRKEVKVLTENDHISHANEAVQEVYSELKEQILKIGTDVTTQPMKMYIAFKAKRNVADIVIQKDKLVLFINLKKGELLDMGGKSRDIKGKGHWGNGDYSLDIRKREDIPYAVSLVQQSYKKNR